MREHADRSNAHCGACNNACPSGQTCTAGACMVVNLCGNGVVDMGEQCDDSNRVDDDGCESNWPVHLPGYRGRARGAYRATLDPSTNHRYLGFVLDGTPWDTARTNCMTYGGYLAAEQQRELHRAHRDQRRGCRRGSTWPRHGHRGGNNPNAFQDVLGGSAPVPTTTSARGAQQQHRRRLRRVLRVRLPPAGHDLNDARCSLSYHYVCEFNN
ncbi:MAG: hypothetical protein U0325_13730 [Polyangiales bacterium]